MWIDQMLIQPTHIVTYLFLHKTAMWAKTKKKNKNQNKTKTEQKTKQKTKQQQKILISVDMFETYEYVACNYVRLTFDWF